VGLLADFFQLSALNGKGLPDFLDSIFSVVLLDWGGVIAVFPEDRPRAFFFIIGIAATTLVGLGVLAALFAYQKRYPRITQALGAYLDTIAGVMYLPIVEQSVGIIIWAWDSPVRRVGYLLGTLATLAAFVPFCLFITQVYSQLASMCQRTSMLVLLITG